ncbi:MAG TPA: hypothetical protein VES95_13625 [Dermatophilaceae bacterium]|nr:hypothetical protein [Dermatophilaceae bacterium]
MRRLLRERLGRVVRRNSAGTTDLLVDVFGTFEFPDPPAAAATAREAVRSSTTGATQERPVHSTAVRR